MPHNPALRTADSILDLIGSTPMLELRRLVPAEGRASIHAKLEFLNQAAASKTAPPLALSLTPSSEARSLPA